MGDRSPSWRSAHAYAPVSHPTAPKALGHDRLGDRGWAPTHTFSCTPQPLVGFFPFRRGVLCIRACRGPAIDVSYLLTQIPPRKESQVAPVQFCSGRGDLSYNGRMAENEDTEPGAEQASEPKEEKKQTPRFVTPQSTPRNCCGGGRR